jgi:hypothetical protein
MAERRDINVRCDRCGAANPYIPTRWKCEEPGLQFYGFHYPIIAPWWSFMPNAVTGGMVVGDDYFAPLLTELIGKKMMLVLCGDCADWVIDNLTPEQYTRTLNERDEVATAKDADDLLQADDEITAWWVPCPTCKADVDEPCTRRNGEPYPLHDAHVKRRNAASRVRWRMMVIINRQYVRLCMTP